MSGAGNKKLPILTNFANITYIIFEMMLYLFNFLNLKFIAILCGMFTTDFEKVKLKFRNTE